MTEPTTHGMSALDDLFGVHTVSVGDAQLRVRRVLTKEQQHVMVDVVVAASKIGERTKELQAQEGLSAEQLEEGIAAIDRDTCARVIDAIHMLCLDDLPDLATLSLTSLSWLFGELRDAAEQNTRKAVARTGFPLKG